MNVTLRQLRAFLAVTRTGSFTLAAESLYITQSALSGLIKELEQVLGVRLFDRSTRRIQMSEVGRGIYPLIEKILTDLDGALDEVANIKALKRGVVRVAAQLMACAFARGDFGVCPRDFPNITVRLTDCAVERDLTGLLGGGGSGYRAKPGIEFRYRRDAALRVAIPCSFSSRTSTGKRPFSAMVRTCRLPVDNAAVSSPSVFRSTFTTPCAT